MYKCEISPKLHPQIAMITMGIIRKTRKYVYIYSISPKFIMWQYSCIGYEVDNEFKIASIRSKNKITK